MRKFCGLVINEYVKILCKASTKIMLAVIIIISLGFNFLLYFASNSGNQRYYYSGWGYDDYISDAKTQQYEGWERTVELYTYMKENDVDINGTISSNSNMWRTEAAYTLFEAKDKLKEAGSDTYLEKYIKDIDMAIKNKDWKLYYQATLADYERVSSDEPDKELREIRIWGLKYKIDNNIAPDNWKNGIINNILQDKQALLQYADINETDEKYAEKIETENRLAIAEYRLENNIEQYTYDGVENGNVFSDKPGFWNIFASSVMTISIISVLIIVIAGSLLSSEFSAGTVKFLLINPVKRWKIFVAKYVTVLSMTLATVFALYIFNMIFAGIFFGFNGLGAPYLAAEGGTIITGSSFLFVAGKYLLGSVGMVCMATFAFAISSLVRNSALSIGLGVFLFLMGSGIVQILSQLGIYQAKYILFANTDLNAVLNGTTGFINHTLAFALVNIAVYMFVFLLTAWDGFVRNDVK